MRPRMGLSRDFCDEERMKFPESRVFSKGLSCGWVKLRNQTDCPRLSACVFQPVLIWLVCIRATMSTHLGVSLASVKPRKSMRQAGCQGYLDLKVQLQMGAVQMLDNLRTRRIVTLEIQFGTTALRNPARLRPPCPSRKVCQASYSPAARASTSVQVQ